MEKYIITGNPTALTHKISLANNSTSEIIGIDAMLEERESLRTLLTPSYMVMSNKDEKKRLTQSTLQVIHGGKFSGKHQRGMVDISSGFVAVSKDKYPLAAGEIIWSENGKVSIMKVSSDDEEIPDFSFVAGVSKEYNNKAILVCRIGSIDDERYFVPDFLVSKILVPDEGYKGKAQVSCNFSYIANGNELGVNSAIEMPDSRATLDPIAVILSMIIHHNLMIGGGDND